MNLPLLLIGCADYDEECNRIISKFVHHFIDCTGRLQCFRIQGSHSNVIHMVLGISFICMCAC